MVQNKKQIYVFVIAFKEKHKRQFLPNSTIRQTFENIGNFPYSRYPKGQGQIPLSKCQWLGDVTFSMFLEDKDNNQDNSIKFFIGRERTGNFPPTIEQTQQNTASFGEVIIPKGKNLIEEAHGRIFFNNRFPNHAIVLFQKNYHACSFSRVIDYIRKKTNYSLNVTILNSGDDVNKLISQLQEVKFVQIHNQNITPSAMINFGTEKRRLRSGISYKAQYLKLAFINQRRNPRTIMREILKAFSPESAYENFDVFATSSKMSVYGLKSGEDNYQWIDLAKNLYLFEYIGEDSQKFNKEEFFNECNNQYNSNREEIENLIDAIINFDERN